MSNAPVCKVSTDEVITQPAPKSLPSVPVASDLASAIAAINALRQIINSMLGAANGAPAQGFNTKNSNGQQGARYTEIRRVTEDVKVTNPDDSSQYVMVKRIKTLAMKDNLTGEQWIWNL